jgi:hypothetical protein
MQDEVFIVLIVLITVGGSLAVALTIVMVAMRNRRRRMEMIHAERLAAIEKGLPLPMDYTETDYPRRRLFVPGLVWAAVGVGIILFGLVGREDDHDLVGLGIIPLLVGIALLIGDVITYRRLKRMGNGGGTYPGADASHRDPGNPS